MQQHGIICQTNTKNTLVRCQAKVTNNKQLINDIVRINVLKEEATYYRTLLQDYDTGHIQTAIYVIEDRIQQLEGKKKRWTFD